MRTPSVTTGDAQQRQQRVDPQTPSGRLSKNVQPIADLRFLEVTQIRVQTRQPNSRIGIAVQLFVELQFTVNVGVAYQLQNVTLQLAGTPRVKQLSFVVLVSQQLQIAQWAVGFSPCQRWHQVVDNHRLSPAFSLSTLTGVVNDKGIDVRHRPQNRIRPALL